jgi:alpha-beta hydrolase superfamily lysophospholipase
LLVGVSVQICAVPAGAADRVSLRAADGTPLAGALYVPTAMPAAAVVLVHMLRRSSADWSTTAERLRDGGFVVLAVDLRGHGDSGGTIDSSGDLTGLVRDVTAAVAFVKQRPGVAAGRIGIAGASVGANLALLAAAADPAVRSVALLSAGLEYRGLRCEAAIAKYGDRPLLLVAGTNDPYAVRSARRLAELDPRAQVETPEGAGHGTLMLAHAPDLVSRLVDWFRTTLL